MTEDLKTQIETTAAKLAQLQKEQSDLTQKMGIAADDADSASLISLKHRANDLPVEILATQIRLERLYLRRAEEKLPELEAEAQRLSPPIFELQKQIAELQTKLNKAVGSQQDATQNVRDLKERIRDGKFEIERLIHSAQPKKQIGMQANFGG